MFAGVFGKRLRTFTNEIPMLPRAGAPLIKRKFRWLKKNGIDDLVHCLGYLEEKIMEHVGDGSKFGITITYSVEEEKMRSTGGNIHALAAVQMTNPSGVISTATDDDDDNKEDARYVTEFRQKPMMDSIWINAGIYYFNSRVFDQLPEVGDFEAPVLPMLVRQKTLRAVKFDDSLYYWRSIDSHWELEEASKKTSAL